MSKKPLIKVLLISERDDEVLKCLNELNNENLLQIEISRDAKKTLQLLVTIIIFNKNNSINVYLKL